MIIHTYIVLHVRFSWYSKSLYKKRITETTLLGENFRLKVKKEEMETPLSASQHRLPPCTPECALLIRILNRIGWCVQCRTCNSFSMRSERLFGNEILTPHEGNFNLLCGVCMFSPCPLYGSVKTVNLVSILPPLGHQGHLMLVQP